MEDPERAFEKSKDLAKRTPHESTLSRNNSGRKRNPGWKKQRRKPIPGCTDLQSERIWSTIALRYSGMSDNAIERELGLSEKAIRDMEANHADAFEWCREQYLRNAVTEYGSNLILANVGLSQAAIVASETLLKVISSPNSKTSDRIRAAEIIIKNSGVGMVKPKMDGSKFVEALSEQLATALQEDNQGTYIVDE